MKTKLFFILLTTFLLNSCSQSDNKYLDILSDQLLNLTTVEYQLTLKEEMENQVIFEHTGTTMLDFTDDNPNKIKYYLYDADESQIIFNGFQTYQSIIEENIITTSENNDPEIVNNPLHFSFQYLRNVLPKLLNNKQVTIHQNRDTIIQSNELRAYTFLLDGSYIHPLNYEIIKSETNSKYHLYLTKNDNLPYRLVAPNGKDGSSIRTYDNIKLNVEIDTSIWNGETLPTNSSRLTEKEYYQNRRNNMLSHKGKVMANWKLPSLNNNSKVDLAELTGNVVLLDFWFKGCAPCIASIPELNSIASKYSKDKFKIYGIEFNETFKREILKNYVTKNGVKYPNLFEGKELALHHGITGGPTFMILNKEGEIIHIRSGYSKEHMDEIGEIIELNL